MPRCTFSGSDPNGARPVRRAYASASARRWSAPPTSRSVADIAGELAGAQVALNDAKDRHEQTDTTLQNLLQSVEGAPTEEVAAQILALQTSLQATLQTTAMLLQTSLLKYL